MDLTIRQILSKMGYTNLPTEAMYSYVNKWFEWYTGKTKFHRYSVYNGKKTTRCTRKSLRMAKHMAEDKADLLLNEKVAFVVDKGQEALNAVLKANSFYTEGNQLVEKGQALGTAAFVEYLETNGIGEETVKIDYIGDPRRIWPLSWERGEITECAFVSVSFDRVKGKLYYVSLHLLDGGKYIVQNYLYDAHGDEVQLPEGIQAEWKSGSSVPTFQIYKPNVTNNFEEDNPLGVSLYANAIDTMQVVDAIFDSYFNEFLLGRKRIFVDATLLNVDYTPDGSGEAKPIFDPNDMVFHNLPGMETDKGKPIVESNMELRTEEHRQGLQDTLDLLSEQCGFGKGYYRFETDSVQTATGVINQNSKLYRKIRKDEILLRKTLVDVARGILQLLGEDPQQDISVLFDDSIIEDRSSKIKRSLLEFGQGTIDRVMYFMETRGLSEKAATEFVQKLVEREQDPSLLSPTQKLELEPKEPEDPGATGGLEGAKEEPNGEKSDSARAYHGRHKL